MSSDEMIVWPPVVLIENTGLGADKTTGKKTGLDNQDVRIFIKKLVEVDFKRVICLYDRFGHRGRTFVTFPDNYVGYLHARALHESLEKMNRGRAHWRSENKPLVDENGLNLLYGYLANQREMEELDHSRKIVNRWKMESLKEKVLDPENQREEDEEHLKLQQESVKRKAEDVAEFLETKKSINSQLRAMLIEKNNFINEIREREAQREKTHNSALRDLLIRYKEQSDNKKAAFKKTEEDIRKKMKENKAKVQEIFEGQQNIDHTKQQIERKKKAVEDLTRDLNMEEKIRELEEGMNVKISQLQKQQKEKILKLKQETEKQREELLQQRVSSINEAENEGRRAKEATANAKGGEVNLKCVCCERRFDTNRLRALYTDCGHANVCFPCSQNRWRNSIKTCPSCNTHQADKPETFPVNIFT